MDFNAFLLTRNDTTTTPLTIKNKNDTIKTNTSAVR
jgi:hypothetical protein